MTQEILDYLLIRSALVNNTSQKIIQEIKDKEEYSYLVNNISQLMQKEDFLLLQDDFPDKVSDIIQSHRFEYNYDKKLNEEINYIIDRLKQYQIMTLNHKKELINSWVKQESENRKLPKIYHNSNALLYLISLDAFYFNQMIDGNFIIQNIIEYLSLVNIIMNEFSTVFEEDKYFLEITRKCLNIIKPAIRDSILDCVKSLAIPEYLKLRIVSNYFKNTEDKLNKNYEKNTDLEIDLSYQYVKRGQ